MLEEVAACLFPVRDIAEVGEKRFSTPVVLS
jgi:hypothetical protein